MLGAGIPRCLVLGAERRGMRRDGSRHVCAVVCLGGFWWHRRWWRVQCRQGELVQTPCSYWSVLGKVGSGAELAEPSWGRGSPGHPMAACLGRGKHPMPAPEQISHHQSSERLPCPASALFPGCVFVTSYQLAC